MGRFVISQFGRIKTLCVFFVIYTVIISYILIILCNLLLYYTVKLILLITLLHSIFFIMLIYDLSYCKLFYYSFISLNLCLLLLPIWHKHINSHNLQKSDKRKEKNYTITEIKEKKNKKKKRKNKNNNKNIKKKEKNSRAIKQQKQNAASRLAVSVSLGGAPCPPRLPRNTHSGHHHSGMPYHDWLVLLLPQPPFFSCFSSSFLGLLPVYIGYQIFFFKHIHIRRY